MTDPHRLLTPVAVDGGDAGDTILGTPIRFFLSSTFADFQTERDVLQRRVFPELRRRCAAAGFRLQPIDLRWGVSEAAGTDRQTLRICFDELERCRALSPDFFLLIQLGERYGSTLLPPQVPIALIAPVLPRLTPEERERFDAVYRLDENAIPPEYVLLRAEGLDQVEDEWLRQALLRASAAAGISQLELLPFAGSATHREIQLGLLGEPSGTGQEAGVLCAVRRFGGEPRGPMAERFVEGAAERAERVRALQADVLERVPAEQVLRYEVEWRQEDGPEFDEEALAAAYLALLRPKLETVIAARTSAREAAAARGYDAAALANAAFERDHTAHVVGRDAELTRLAAYLSGGTGAGLPLVVAGVAGTGKSTLLAEVSRRAMSALPGAALVVRYCGVTPGTETLSALLTSLRTALAHLFGMSEPETMTDESQLIGAVASQLATLPATRERPLLLLIDALDQLGTRTQRTDWLPPRLAPNVRVVVSVLADRPELGYLRDRLPAEQVLTLAPLDVEAGRTMLRDLLAVAPARTLTSAQEDAVLAAFAVQGVPLHLRLLAAEARGWRSFDAAQLGDAQLPASTSELLAALLERLEAPERNGRALVERALGDLAAARFGLAEDELLDLLSRDADVRAAQHALSPNSPPIDPRLPLPVALWARLHAQVAPLLTERGADAGTRLLTFYHGQLRSAAEARYLVGSARVEYHRALADYFGEQPWRWGPRQWNWRKVRELVTQLEGADDRTGAEQALGGLADVMQQETDLPATDAAGTIAVMSSLRDHLESAGYWQVGLRLYTQALAAARATGNRAFEGETLGNMGLLADHLGQPEEAADAYAGALVLLREVGNRAGEGSTLNNLGTLAFGRGQVEEAMADLQQALAIRHEVGDRAGEGSTLNNLGQVVELLGQRDAAAQYYMQALAIQREVGDRGGEAVTLNNLGQLAYHLGHADETASYFEQALGILRAVGDRPGEAQTLSNLGSLRARLGHWEDAQRLYEQALAIQREVGDRSAEGSTLTNLGALAAHMGKPQEAARSFEQALEILRAVGDRPSEANTLNSLGALARDQGQFEEAARYYAQALSIVHEVGDRAMEGTLLNNLGSLTRAQGGLDEAKTYFEQALAIERAVGDRTGEGHTLNNLGALVREQDQFEEAASYFAQALAIRREVGDREGEAATLTNLGALARVQGRPEEAARNYAEALAICEAIGAVDLAEKVRGNIEYLNETLSQQHEPEQPEQQTQPENQQGEQQQVEQPKRRRRWAFWPFRRRA